MIREKEKQAALAERQRRTGNVTGDRSERIRTYNDFDITWTPSPASINAAVALQCCVV